MPRLYALALLFALLPACDDDDNDDAQPEADAVTADATLADASKTDAADQQDAQNDASEDAEADAQNDASEDAETDAQDDAADATDAETDAQNDASEDAELDAQDDASEDAETDAQDDASEDAETDASDCPYLCGGSTPICHEGRCVQCVTKDNCTNESDECVQNQCRAPLSCDRRGFPMLLEQLRLMSDGGLAYNAFTAFPDSASSFDNLRVLLIDPGSLQSASYSIADTPREQNYQTCERCVLAFAQCSDMNMCQKVFMATGGLMEVEQIATQIGQQVKLKLSDLVFEEVTINAQNLSQAVENGEHWCVDQFSINKYINSDSAECSVDSECTKPGMTHCDKGACVECTEKEHCGEHEICKFNSCVNEGLENWECDDEWYDEDGYCNCGCGALDPDCADSTRASCDFIICEYTDGNVYSDRNWLCIPQCTAETESEICPEDLPHCLITHCAECSDDDHCPGDDRCLNGICGNCTNDDDCGGTSCMNHHCQTGEWTCPQRYYGDGECDCGCGVKDVDCPDGSLASCSPSHFCTPTAPIDGQNWLCEPECTPQNQSSHCSAPTPVCSAENICVQCTQKSHCSDPTPACTTDNRCVQCVGDEDCAEGTCNTANNRCVTGECDYTGYGSCTYGTSYSTTDGVKARCYTDALQSSQILIELYNEAIAPGSYELQGGDYDLSNFAVFIYDVEGSNANYYYATEGTLVIESVSTTAMTGHIQNAKLKEIHWAPRGNFVENGRVWCLDRYDFSFSASSK